MSGDVEVWWHTASDDPSLAGLLTDRERARAGRRADPALYVTAHALLRCLVADRTSVAPQHVSFDRTCATCGEKDHGKPSVAGHPGLFVSLTYAGGLALAAVTRTGQVGVDVEEVAEAAFEGFDAMTLAAEEAAGFAAVAPESLPRARACVWARKEAVLKATGHGLVVDPRDVVVTAPGQPAALVDWRAEPPLRQPVQLHDLRLEDRGHCAAVAVLADGPVAVRLVPAPMLSAG